MEKTVQSSHEIQIQDLSCFLEALEKGASKYQVYGPLREDGVEDYRRINQLREEEKEGMEKLIFQNAPLLGSVKSFLFPDTEIYLTYQRQGRTMKGEEVKTTMPQIILGVKACDLKAIALLDKVFLAPPQDNLYKAHKENTLIVATACGEMGTHCNCQDFGITSREILFADLVMKQNPEGKILLEGVSTKGMELMTELLNYPGMEKVEIPREFVEEAKEEPLRKGSEDFSLNPEEIRHRMEALFDDKLWERLALRCIGCGSCTYYCPTCHCYDIRDFSRKDQGVRYRTWDSCMFSNFTNMAGDHNPRPRKVDRIKNRFYHKLSYFVKKQEDLACVGCGRCAEVCPVGISINTVLKEIGGTCRV